MAETEPLNGTSAIPAKNAEDKVKAMNGSLGMISAITVVPRLIGTAAAYGILCIPSVAVRLEGKVFNLVVDEGLALLFVAVYCFNLMVTLLNLIPIRWKQAIMNDGNLRANQIIYKDVETGKHVIMDEAEEIGQYNRANRSLHHFVETSMGFCAALLLAGSIFPVPALACCCVFILGRLMHQIGYTTGYGGHGPGFGLAMLAMSTLDGLLLWTSIKAFNA